MRENRSERNSGLDSLNRRKDFRENLFSIFVDNLNVKVDLVCLWGVFKTFGRVRDVFLSLKNGIRKSRFAFIRFDSLEEANKVANLVNGMHIYGWPISAKIASYGWNNRKSDDLRQSVPNKVAGKDRGVRRDKLSNKKFRSFAEVLKGEDRKTNVERNVGEEDCLSMEWWKQNSVEDWLLKCAVGVLKEFSNVSSVHKKLRNKGFSYSSSFLGEKTIVWSFESVVEKEGFISNRFFWDDVFSSMSGWSNSFTPHSRIAWINVYGTPLSCWDSSFFKKLGWLIGEPFLIEEETSLRIRLDRGRFLALISNAEPCECKVKVSMENELFEVQLVEDQKPVDLSWISKYLGLKVEDNQSGQFSELENQKSNALARVVGWPESVAVAVQDEKDLIGISDSRQLVSVDKRAKSYGKGREARKGLSVIGTYFQPIGEEAIVVKKKCRHDLINDDDAISLSSDSRDQRASFSNFKGSRGECSSKSVIALGVVEQVGNICEIEEVTESPLGGVQKGLMVHTSEGDSEHMLGLETSPPNFQIKGDILGDSNFQIQVDLEGPNCVSLKTPVDESCKSDVGALSGRGGMELNILDHASAGVMRSPKDPIKEASSGIANNKRGRRGTVLSKNHSMTLRSFGVCSNSKNQNSELNSKKVWNLEDEVAKVLEKGLALGLNFNGKKKELLDIIAKRNEVNDNRFRDLVRRLVFKNKAMR